MVGYQRRETTEGGGNMTRRVNRSMKLEGEKGEEWKETFFLTTSSSFLFIFRGSPFVNFIFLQDFCTQVIFGRGGGGAVKG